MDNTEIIARLHAAQPLADKLATAGMYTPLTPAEQAVLDALREVAQAGAFEQEWQTDELRRAAGLRPSDLGLLLGVLHWQDVQADPKGAIIETLAALRRTRNRPETS